MIAGEWKKTFEDFKKEGLPVPPVMICVCDNTDLAELIFEYISGEKTSKISDLKFQISNSKTKKTRIFAGGKLFPELLGNNEKFQPTIRIDTKLLGEAESEDGAQTKQEVAQALRLRVATVGKTEWAGQGEPPGKDVRCVVSVGMLVKNDHLDFSIPYDFLGVRHYYYPDFLIRYKGNGEEVAIILEVKGYESEQDRQKKTAAERWVKAINYHGGFGRWELLECREPRSMDKILNGLFK